MILTATVIDSDGFFRTVSRALPPGTVIHFSPARGTRDCEIGRERFAVFGAVDIRPQE